MKDAKLALKTMIAARHYTITKLCEDYNARMGTTLTKQGMAYKISHGTMKLKEFIAVCDILDYDIILEERGSHVRLPE